MNQQTPRKERKWGTAASAAGAAVPAGQKSTTRRGGGAGADRDRGDHETSTSSSSSKRTLTDFRIEALGIPELEWEWRAVRVEDAMKRVAEELDRRVDEKKKKKKKKKRGGEEEETNGVDGEDDGEDEGEGGGEGAGKPEEGVTAPEMAASQEGDEPAEDEDETVVDMSVELTAPPASTTDDVPPPIAGKHRREEEEEQQEDAPLPSAPGAGAAAAVGTTALNGTGTGSVQNLQESKPHSDYASKPKKVRVGDAEPATTVTEEVLTVGAAAIHPDVDSTPSLVHTVEVAAELATDADEGDPPANGGDAAAETEAGRAEDALEPEQPAPVRNGGGDDDDAADVPEEEEEEEDVDGAPIEAAADSESVTGRPETSAATSSSPTKASRNASTLAPPRENSRLRIYFSTPVASTSSYIVPGSTNAQDKSSSSAREEKDRRESTVPTVAVKENPNETAAAAADTASGQEAIPAEEQHEEKEVALPDAVPAVVIDSSIDEEIKPIEGAAAAAAVDSDSTGAGFAAPAQTAETATEVDSAIASDQHPKPDEEILPDAPAVSKVDAEASEAPAEPAAGGAADASTGEGPTDDVDGEPVTEGESRQASPAPSATPSVVPEEAAPQAPLPPEPAADRISISYARNTRRMVLDADVIESVKVYRGEGRIELVVRCKPAVYGDPENPLDDDFRVCKGVLVRAWLPGECSPGCVILTIWLTRFCLDSSNPSISRLTSTSSWTGTCSRARGPATPSNRTRPQSTTASCRPCTACSPPSKSRTRRRSHSPATVSPSRRTSIALTRLRRRDGSRLARLTSTFSVSGSVTVPTRRMRASSASGGTRFTSSTQIR